MLATREYVSDASSVFVLRWVAYKLLAANFSPFEVPCAPLEVLGSPLEVFHRLNEVSMGLKANYVVLNVRSARVRQDIRHQ